MNGSGSFFLGFVDRAAWWLWLRDEEGRASRCFLQRRPMGTNRQLCISAGARFSARTGVWLLLGFPFAGDPVGSPQRCGAAGRSWGPAPCQGPALVRRWVTSLADQYLAGRGKASLGALLQSCSLSGARAVSLFLRPSAREQASAGDTCFYRDFVSNQ